MVGSCRANRPCQHPKGWSCVGSFHWHYRRQVRLARSLFAFPVGRGLRWQQVTTNQKHFAEYLAFQQEGEIADGLKRRQIKQHEDALRVFSPIYSAYMAVTNIIDMPLSFSISRWQPHIGFMYPLSCPNFAEVSLISEMCLRDFGAICIGEHSQATSVVHWS